MASLNKKLRIAASYSVYLSDFFEEQGITNYNIKMTSEGKVTYDLDPMDNFFLSLNFTTDEITENIMARVFTNSLELDFTLPRNI